MRPLSVFAMLSLTFALAVAAAPAAEEAAPAQDPQELVFVFQKQKDPAQIKEHADRVAEVLTQKLGMPVTTFVPQDYAATVQAMVSKKADIGYMDSIPFLLARRDAGATILLAEQRVDAQGEARTDYDSVFVVRQDSPLRSIDDLIAGARELRMVFTSPTSTSGYVMAYRRLVKEGLLRARQDPKDVFASVNFGGGYTQALQQVLDNRADVAAVSYYTVEGETADVYLPREQRERLRILARTPGVPTHVIAARGGLSEGLRERIKQALLELSEEHPELLQDVYGAKTFVEVDADEHVAATAEALSYLGLAPEGIVNPKK